MLDLKTNKLYNSWKEEEGKTFHVLQVLGMSEDLWNRVCGLGSKASRGCEWVELLVVQTCLTRFPRSNICGSITQTLLHKCLDYLS